ncbi:hypothetical protein HYQ46_000360 [Verticillium longisporum]|nr:hypothetical protein HYQ46_000360 [Verticillium longisporum]
MEPTIFDAADKVIETFALDDPVENNLVAFGTVGSQGCSVVGFGDPLRVADVEGTHNGLDALLDELLLQIISVFRSADFADVEEEVNREGSGGELDRGKLGQAITSGDGPVTHDPLVRSLRSDPCRPTCFGPWQCFRGL